jgi:hypothetical protein
MWMGRPRPPSSDGRLPGVAAGVKVRRCGETGARRAAHGGRNRRGGTFR